ncbi:hypothetical protein ACSPX5_08185 [Pseudomonas sp. HLG18]|uniref:hypothetical protein n=1 Tax=Pseudomonas sp. HLG18 TaxID=3449277 RepID=UPI003F749A1A
MSAFGLSFTNSSNEVVLDSEYARLCVIFTGRYSPNFGPGSYGSLVTFPRPITTVEQPLIFIRPDTVNGIVQLGATAALQGSPGNWTGFVTSMYNQIGFYPNGRYIVASFGAQSLAEYGVRLFSATGQPIFDTGTPSVQFTRAFQNWTYVMTGRGDQGEYINYYTVPFDFPENEYLLCNSFSMRMTNADNVGRGLYTWWDFQKRVLYAVTIGFSNPYAFWLPAMFAKLDA